MYKLWEALKEARKYRWVELSHSLNNDSPYFGAYSYPAFPMAPYAQCSISA